MLIDCITQLEDEDNEMFVYACSRGFLRTVEEMINKKTREQLVSAIYHNDNLSLRNACENGHTEVVKLLVENGATIDTRNNSPLMLACQKGHLDIVKFLIEKGANSHIGNDLPIQWADHLMHSDLMKYLFSLEPDLYWITHSNKRIREIYGKFRERS